MVRFFRYFTKFGSVSLILLVANYVVMLFGVLVTV